jgi:hypothetical protein
MKAHADRRAAAFLQQHERRLRAAELQGAIYAPIIAAAERDEKAVAAAHAFRTLAPAGGTVTRPRVPPVTPWGTTSPLGATAVPPYYYSFGGPYHTGAGKGSVTIDSADGTILIVSFADYDDSGSAEGEGALGIPFSAPTATGVLDVWSAPVLTWSWFDWAVFDVAVTYAALDLMVFSYDHDGNVSIPVDQRTILWNDQSHISETDDTRGDVAFQLHVSLPVDDSHFYVLWVYADVGAAGPGHGFFRGGGANAQLYMVVPSISWRFIGSGSLPPVFYPSSRSLQ